MDAQVWGNDERVANLVGSVFNLHAFSMGYSPAIDILVGVEAPALPAENHRNWLALQAVSDLEVLAARLFTDDDEFSVLKRHQEALKDFLEGYTEALVTPPKYLIPTTSSILGKYYG